MNDRCPRCAVLEDLLETANISIERARRESEKANDEAVEHKVENLRLRAEGTRADYAVIKHFQRRTEEAEKIATGMGYGSLLLALTDLQCIREQMGNLDARSGGNS